MSSLPEPSDVGPAVGGDIPATDLDRDHVVTLLTEATNEGLLLPDERDRRVRLARVAETFDDLVPLTRDLVSVDGILARPAAAAPIARIDTTSPATTDADQIVAVFSGSTRKGHWRVRQNTSALAVFGGVELDLTEAVFEAQTITLNAFCLFGGIELTVPVGTEVRNHAAGIFGGIDTKVAPPAPGAPLVIIKGAAIFGGVEVRNPKTKRRQRS